MRQPPLRVPRSGGTWGSVNSPRTKRYWGTQRVARVCQVSPATVANWIDQGLLKGHKTPTGRRRVEAEDLTALLHAHEMAEPPQLEGGNGHDVGGAVGHEPGYRKRQGLAIGRTGPEVTAGDAE